MTRQKKQETDWSYVRFMLIMSLPVLVVVAILLGMIQYTVVIFPIEKATCAASEAGMMTGMGEPSIMSIGNETYFRCRAIQNETERIIAVKTNKTWIG